MSNMNEVLMDSIRAKYPVLDAMSNSTQYAETVMQEEIRKAFLEIQFLRRKADRVLHIATSAELVEELHSRISIMPPTSGTING